MAYDIEYSAFMPLSNAVGGGNIMGKTKKDAWDRMVRAIIEAKKRYDVIYFKFDITDYRDNRIRRRKKNE